MKNIIRKIKGTNDILPDESLIWIYFENYIRDFFQKYGYKEIRTPIFESTELFLRSIGKDTDIVSKEMYSWVDQGNNNLTLRPELTASVSRSFIQNQLSKQQKSHKFYYIGSSFRRERPQKGRFRQFEQFGIESFGSPFPEQDVEIISMAYLFYKSLNIKNLNLTINTIGSREDRKKYVQSLKEYFNKFENKLTSISKKRLESNPLRILDTKIDFEIELVKKAPKIIDYISDEDKKRLPKPKKLSDITMKHFHHTQGCQGTHEQGKRGFQTSLYRRTYTSSREEDSVFGEYVDNIKDILDSAAKHEKELLDYLDRIFKQDTNPISGKKEITIVDDLTMTTLKQLIDELRVKQVDMYVECEKKFYKGFKLFEKIILCYYEKNENIKQIIIKFHINI